MTGTHVLPDPATPFGETVRARLRDEQIIWLTTVAPSGTPQPNPVWFLWQPDPDDAWGDGSFLIYHDNAAHRLRTLTERPRVALNFNAVTGGGGITVFTGTRRGPRRPPARARDPRVRREVHPAACRAWAPTATWPSSWPSTRSSPASGPEKVRGF